MDGLQFKLDSIWPNIFVWTTETTESKTVKIGDKPYSDPIPYSECSLFIVWVPRCAQPLCSPPRVFCFDPLESFELEFPNPVCGKYFPYYSLLQFPSSWDWLQFACQHERFLNFAKTEHRCKKTSKSTKEERKRLSLAKKKKEREKERQGSKQLQKGRHNKRKK